MKEAKQKKSEGRGRELRETERKHLVLPITHICKLNQSTVELAVLKGHYIFYTGENIAFTLYH